MLPFQVKKEVVGLADINQFLPISSTYLITELVPRYVQVLQIKEQAGLDALYDGLHLLPIDPA